MHKEIIRIALDTLDKRLKEIGGCGDSGCIIVRPIGMCTNGGCRCNTDKHKMTRVVGAHNSFTKTIREM